MRFIVPFKFEHVFTPYVLHDLRQLEISPEWIMEYVLYIWLTLAENQEDRIYEQVAADIAEGFLTTVDYDDESVNSRAGIFSHTADRYVHLIKDVYDQMAPYLGNLPMGAPDKVLDTMTLDNFLPNAVAIRFVFEEEEEPVYMKGGAWRHYPKALLAEPHPRPNFSDKTFEEALCRMSDRFPPAYKLRVAPRENKHMHWDENEFDLSTTSAPLSPELARLASKILRFQHAMDHGVSDRNAEVQQIDRDREASRAASERREAFRAQNLRDLDEVIRNRSIPRPAPEPTTDRWESLRKVVESLGANSTEEARPIPTAPAPTLNDLKVIQQNDPALFQEILKKDHESRKKFKK